MAHKESGLLAVSDSYSLGKYTLTLQNVVSEGERVIQAHCSGPEGNAAHGISVSTDTQVEGWYIEVNDTEATVYVSKKLNKNSPLIEGDLIPVSAGQCGYYENPEDLKIEYNLTFNYAVNAAKYQNTVIAAMPYDSSAYSLIACHRNSYYWSSSKKDWVPSGGKGTGSSPHRFSYDGKQVVYSTIGAYWADSRNAFNLLPSSDVQPRSSSGFIVDKIAWSLVYATPGEEEPTDILVARFAIDLGEAGGYPGGGGDWDEEGDYDPEHDPEDPTRTLYLTVNGALSGRHNDPIEDNSYSYIPEDKLTQKPYGCGGDGGHGGGGGAGASTVVIHKFATNQANSKEVTAIARRHGYGSGGGKGGKGGDGIILIYY